MPQQSVQVARALIANDYANAKDRSTHTHRDAHTHTLAHHKLWVCGGVTELGSCALGVSLCEKL